jgi:hypothetical protein
MASKTDSRLRRVASPKARMPARAPVSLKSDDPLYLQVVVLQGRCKLVRRAFAADGGVLGGEVPRLTASW